MSFLGFIGQMFWPRVDEDYESTTVSAGYSNPWGYLGGTRSAGQGWYGGLGSSGSSPTMDHYTLRQNARHAVQDTSAARAIVERFADIVVDTGLVLEATPRADVLGIAPEQAEAWARDVEARFDLWARGKGCCRDRSLTFYQAQRVVEVFTQRDNDSFIRLFFSDDADLLNPLQFSFVDPNQIGGFGFTSTIVASSQDDGIMRDEAGREVGYKVYVEDGPYNYVMREVPARTADGRRLMLHCYQPEYAGQGRGFSRLSHALQEFENLTDFSSAQIKKAINQSSLTMFVKPSKDKPASNIFEGIMSGGAGPIVSESLSTTLPDTSIPPSLVYTPAPEYTATRPGSAAVVNLDSGEELVPFSNTAPSESFPAFVDSFASHIAASLSIPLEVVLMKFNANYSASRACLLLFWRVATRWRDELASDFLNPIYEEWLSGEIAAGRIIAPGWQDARLRAAWLANNWIGAPIPNIDPQNTASAIETYMKLGLTTGDREARNLNGSSGSANRSKLSQEYAELPVPPWENKGNTNAITD